MLRIVASRELIRFGLVGLLQNAVNLAVFAGTVALGVTYAACAGLAALTALAVSFVLNRGFTFARSDRAFQGQLWRYVIVFLASLLAGIGVLVLAVELAGVDALLGQLIAIIVVAPLSYLAHRHWTFHGRASVGAPSA